jgi:transcriptional regulator with XRE-family HTH domain
MTKEKIGEILKHLRLNANMTQKQVASAIGRTQQIIGHWETGYSQPDADTLFILCDLYGASVDEAFGYNKKSPTTVATEVEELSEYEHELIKNYRSMNDDGKMAARDSVEALTSLAKYKKCDDSQELA